MTGANVDDVPDPARSWREWARGLVRLRHVRLDVVDALRAGGCVGLVVVLGWWAGDISAGLTASIGTFTALYGGRLPYGARARRLALVAVAFAAVATLGAGAEVSWLVAVPVVTVVAVAATAICQVARIGPPGAYMFVLACATASAVPGAADAPWRLGLLALAGGAVSWVAHMCGLLAGRRRRERRTVETAAAAVGDRSATAAPVPRAARVPVGGPGDADAWRALLAAGSPWRLVLVRVGVGALLAGTAGSALGLDHAYWVTASAVLVLCQGASRPGTLERAVLRLLGTWAGLLLAAAVLAAQPSGLWLAVTVAALQCAIQLAMPLNYGLGVVFITPMALTVGSAGNPDDLGELLLARGLDTLAGCALGVVVFLLVRPAHQHHG